MPFRNGFSGSILYTMPWERLPAYWTSLPDAASSLPEELENVPPQNFSNMHIGTISSQLPWENSGTESLRKQPSEPMVISTLHAHPSADLFLTSCCKVLKYKKIQLLKKHIPLYLPTIGLPWFPSLQECPPSPDLTGKSHCRKFFRKNCSERFILSTASIWIPQDLSYLPSTNRLRSTCTDSSRATVLKKNILPGSVPAGKLTPKA